MTEGKNPGPSGHGEGDAPVVVERKRSKRKYSTGGQTMAEGTNPNPSDPGERGAPVVVERRRGKRKYSTGLRNVQVMERGFTRAIHRVARSLERGIGVYEEARNESASKTRDGAIVDFIPNVADGFSSLLETLTPLPNDLAKALYPTRTRRAVRNATRIVGDIFDVREDDDKDDDDEDEEDDKDDKYDDKFDEED